MTRAWLTCLVVAALLLPAGYEEAPPAAMNVFIAGINSRGTSFLHDAALLDRDGRNFRIELVATGPGENGVRRAARGAVQYIADRGTNPADTSIIRVTGPDDPRLRDVLLAIAREPQANVNIDMDLVGLGGRHWTDQTTKAAGIAALLADERARALPASRNSIVAHSAGTVALSRLLQTTQREVFHQKAAASPMTWELPQDVVIIQAKGDLPSTESGEIRAIELGTAAALDRDRWLGHGNRVIRISTDRLDVPPGLAYAAARAAALAAGPLALEAFDRVAAHTAASAIGARDREVEVSLPIEARAVPGEPPPPTRFETFTLTNVSSGKVLNAFSGLAGPSITGGNSRRMTWDDLKDTLRALEPPKGGGVALAAVALLPIDPGAVARARWDADGALIVLEGASGRRWRLPPMDPELVAVAHQCLFGDRPADPEFSIGPPLEPGVEDPAPAGSWIASFSPERILRNTKLGRVLFDADVALAQIAFGGTPHLAARGLDAIEGYHSLAEMYPDKYADHPTVPYGRDDRIVIQSLPARLEAAASDTLTFDASVELATRFGRTTAAERGYAEIFAASHDALMSRVPELSRLVQASRIVGVLKWLRANAIPFDVSALVHTPPASYVTPYHVEFTPVPRRRELVRRRPLVTYGEHGPTEILPHEGAPTRIEYDGAGRVASVLRGDGRVLRVYRDDLGTPLGYEVPGVGAAGFSRNADGDSLFHPDVVLVRNGAGHIGFDTTRSAGIPETDPSALLTAAAFGFVTAADLRASPQTQPEPGPDAIPAAEPARRRLAIAAAGLVSVVLLVLGWRLRSRRRRPPAA